MAETEMETPGLSFEGQASEGVAEKLLDKSSPEDRSSGNLKWSSPAVIGLFAAALGLFGNFTVAWYNDRNTRELNRAKMQSDLIQQAVNTHSLQQSCRNLLFFIDTALLVDRKGKITQECLYPLPQTEIPFSAAAASAAAAPAVSVASAASGVAVAQSVTASTDMGIKVSKAPSADGVRFQVSFTVPSEPNSAVFNTVKIYCTQLANRERVKSKIYPELQGNWKAGDRVSFTVDVPKALANTTTGWNLTFCVGTDAACYPSPNLLMFAS
ncbi:hypothetical protein [Granulicella sp. dw_53]|uniref:hypothetical protein n=1 Tax=Granulicella sp. dw_53 TaxID=2719792 RepID=UPI001BD62064|nr:hypothetical protein [Granulicella sp. dw_53]